MARVIAIADDVYRELTSMKGRRSYSEVIRDSIGKGGNREKILSFFGKGDIDPEKIRLTDKMWGKWSKKYA